MKARHALRALLVLTASALSACSLDSRGPSGAADVVYHGGVILTMTDAAPRVEALAVRDGKIVAVGPRAQVDKLAGAKTQTVDLQGRTLLPGFVDSHGHVYGVGLQAASANLLPPPDGEGRDIAALQRLLTAWDRGAPSPLKKHGWIVGFGYDDSQLREKRHPTRGDLDRVSKDKPVLVIHQSGQVGAANSKALQLAGVTASTSDPKAGFVAVLQKLLGRFDPETHQALVRAGADMVARYGFTTSQEARSAGKPVLLKVNYDNGHFTEEKLVTFKNFASQAEIIDKFEKLASHTLAQERVGELRDAVLGLENLQDTARLAVLMSK